MKPKLKTIVVRVSKDNIRDGKPGYAAGCPIALALNPFMSSVDVVGAKGVMYHGRYAALPVAAQTFIRHFDFGVAVMPFTFRMKVPVSWLKKSA